VDVGYGQVDWKLRNDPRVILRERTNLRHLTAHELYGESDSIPDLTVVDVSFISLTKVLPALWRLTKFPRDAVLLVKPQFEVGKSRVGKKGVVRDPHDQADAIFQVLQVAFELGWKYKGLTWSPITGPAGNIEYLLWLGMESDTPAPSLDAIKQITKSALTSPLG
jgi:23S rRNA (cytidine1920-2'-O)/16S rRNA (cytidine1409-2'-O)-methyltransferase